eukprot:gene26117-biopygen14154
MRSPGWIRKREGLSSSDSDDELRRTQPHLGRTAVEYV